MTMHKISGVAASPGFAVGNVHSIRRQTIVPKRKSIDSAKIPSEIERFRIAVEQARNEIQVLVEAIAKELGPEEAAILSSQLLILEDALVWDATLAVIRMERINAEAAFGRAVGDIASHFLEIEDDTFRERVEDLRDVEQRVLRAFTGEECLSVNLPEKPSIIAAKNLTPSDTAVLGRDTALGFLMDEGGATSHVAIMAKSLGVPAIVGLQGQAMALENGTYIIVDGNEGCAFTEPDDTTSKHYDFMVSKQVAGNEKLAYLKDLPAITPDGRQIGMMANIGLPLEVDEALTRGAEGIGLLRTEYIFFRHHTIPTEDEQVGDYTEILTSMSGKPVIFRTLDVGGDKVSDLLGAKREYNPFLGWRGIRFSLANRAMFKTQIKAIYRAAVSGPAKIMFPMITGVNELRIAREICDEAVSELKQAGVPHDSQVPIGIMIETPSAVLGADLLAAECDFFSIGTNDLIQYTLAMDRGNSRVSYLYRPLHPAVLRSIDRTVQAAHGAGIKVGLCGEMGSETRLAEVLLGLGLDDISLHGAALPKVKQVIRWTEYAEACKIVEHLLTMSTADDTDKWLNNWIVERKRFRAENQEK